MIVFLIEWIFIALGLIGRTIGDLSTPDAELPPNASRGAAWAGLGVGVVLLGLLLSFATAATIESLASHGEYGTINGVPVSRADYEMCGGKIPDGCPGGATGIFNKYEMLRRQRG